MQFSLKYSFNEIPANQPIALQVTGGWLKRKEIKDVDVLLYFGTGGGVQHFPTGGDFITYRSTETTMNHESGTELNFY